MKSGASEPAPAFSPQEAPTNPATPRSGKDEALDRFAERAWDEEPPFERRAWEGWNSDEPLTDDQLADVEAARARALAFAKDCSLLDWLDAPEPFERIDRAYEKVACKIGESFPLAPPKLAADSQGHGETAPFAVSPAGGGATGVGSLRTALQSNPPPAPPGEIVEGGDANAKDRDSRKRLHEPAPLVRVTGGALAALAQEATAHATRSKSKRTLVEYEKQWTAFGDWCREHGRVALPADAATLALYITERARDVGLSSIGQALSAIVYYHDRERVPAARHDPVVKEVLDGITRGKGRARKKKDALTLVKLQRIVPVLSGETAIRDRALLLIGYVAGLRRSELVATKVEHFKRDDLGRGYVLTIPRSKTDQSGEGRLKAIPVNRRSRVMCPASALEDWLQVSGIVSGPVFRGIQHCTVTSQRVWGEDVARVVKRWAKRAGVEGWENLSGHSLRAGFITDARRNKQSWASITKQTGQTEKTAEGYVREEEIWEDNAAVELFR